MRPPPIIHVLAGHAEVKSDMDSLIDILANELEARLHRDLIFRWFRVLTHLVEANIQLYVNKLLGTAKSHHCQ